MAASVPPKEKRDLWSRGRASPRRSLRANVRGRRQSECRRHAPRFETARTGRTSIRRIYSGYCARRAMAHAMAMHPILCRLRCHRRIATCDRRERDGCERGGGGPNLLCELVPGRARVDGTLPKGVQPQPRHSSSLVHDAQVCGRAQLRPTVVDAHRSSSGKTSSGRRARCASRAFPEGASASTFPAGACRCLIGCLHHRRAHGLLVPASITHDVEHGEGGAESTVRSSDSRARPTASSKAAPLACL